MIIACTDAALLRLFPCIAASPFEAPSPTAKAIGLLVGELYALACSEFFI